MGRSRSNNNNKNTEKSGTRILLYIFPGPVAEFAEVGVGKFGGARRDARCLPLWSLLLVFCYPNLAVLGIFCRLGCPSSSLCCTRLSLWPKLANCSLLLCLFIWGEMKRKKKEAKVDRQGNADERIPRVETIHESTAPAKKNCCHWQQIKIEMNNQRQFQAPPGPIGGNRKPCAIN